MKSNGSAPSTTVLNEMMGAGDKAIPRAILDKAEAIAIFPGVKKAGFVLGGQWGRGVISVRDADTRKWSSPAFLTMTGGSVGRADWWNQRWSMMRGHMNRSGVEHLLSNQVKLGGEISAAAGPVGRAGEASTDLQMRAQILSYSPPGLVRRRRSCSTGRPSKKTWMPIPASMGRLSRPRTSSSSEREPRLPASTC